MMLILDDDLRNIASDDSWSTRRRSVLDHRLEHRADLDAVECLRDHRPSARTLERLGFTAAMARPNYAAQRRLATTTAQPDAINPDWKPL